MSWWTFAHLSMVSRVGCKWSWSLSRAIPLKNTALLKSTTYDDKWFHRSDSRQHNQANQKCAWLLPRVSRPTPTLSTKWLASVFSYLITVVPGVKSCQWPLCVEDRGLVLSEQNTFPVTSSFLGGRVRHLHAQRSYKERWQLKVPSWVGARAHRVLNAEERCSPRYRWTHGVDIFFNEWVIRETPWRAWSRPPWTCVRSSVRRRCLTARRTSEDNEVSVMWVSL